MSQHPPSLIAFNTQVTDLIARHGAEAFCAASGQTPAYTLFVEDDTVIAEPQNAPRHPYGIYCVIRAGSSDSQKAEQVHKWVQSGTAYQEFLATNLCRYNC